MEVLLTSLFAMITIFLASGFEEMANRVYEDSAKGMIRSAEGNCVRRLSDRFISSRPLEQGIFTIQHHCSSSLGKGQVSE